jgi:hypothetical protein
MRLRNAPPRAVTDGKPAAAHLRHRAYEVLWTAVATTVGRNYIQKGLRVPKPDYLGPEAFSSSQRPFSGR